MKKEAGEFFDRVYVINLKRRRDRLEEFRKRLRSIEWPFREPEVFYGVEGDVTGVPGWWGQGGGAWGCLMSHVRILEQCLQDGVESVLFLEDDVSFIPDFGRQVTDWLPHVPDDWEHLYLGGQHLRNPEEENEWVFKCKNVNRTHAHAMRGRFMKRAYKHVLHAPDYMKFRGSHIDHRLGALHETGTVKAYAPKPNWFCSQAAGKSDISGRQNPEYFWNTWKNVPDLPLFVILDVHCGYGSQVASILDKVMHFGHTLGGWHHRVEDKGLSDVAEQAFPFPSVVRRSMVENTAGILHDWIGVIQCEASNYGQVAGACYPTVCAMYEDFARAWKSLKVINVETSVKEATEKLIKRSDRAEDDWLTVSATECEEVQEFLYLQKKQWLKNCETLRVDPKELEDEPSLVEKIRAFTRGAGSRSVSKAG